MYRFYYLTLKHYPYKIDFAIYTDYHTIASYNLFATLEYVSLACYIGSGGIHITSTDTVTNI